MGHSLALAFWLGRGAAAVLHQFLSLSPLPSWCLGLLLPLLYFVLERFFVVFLLTVVAATTLPRLVPAALPLLYLVLPFFLVVVLEALTLNAGWCPPRRP